MVMKKHDGPVGDGFRGYDRPREDPNGVPASGNSNDTYVRSASTPFTHDQLYIQYRFMSGELTREEAEKQLDMLAANTVL